MNARITTLLAGLVTLGLGITGLFKPLAVMGMVGFMNMDASTAALALGEIRATYGGLFTVIGVYALWAAIDPVAHRGRILFIGAMWLGAAGGRLLGVSVDGNPGLFGWLAVVLETLIGGAFLVAALTAEERGTYEPAMPTVTPQPAPPSPAPPPGPTAPPAAPQA